jgi:SAM-dependent methyltransferase
MEKEFLMARVCPICGNDSDIRDLLKDMRGWSCNKCFHAWRPPPWEAAGAIKYFEDAHYTKAESANRISRSNLDLFDVFETMASAIAKDAKKLMLDFGCSYGICMEVFKAKKWDVFGIEISPSSQKILTQKNLRWAASLENSGLEYGCADVVVMADSIYYLPDPVNTLSVLRRYLKPGGILIIRQPTRGGLARAINAVSGSSPFIEKLWLDHIHLFSRRSTQVALSRAGFGNISFRKEQHFKRSLKGELMHRSLRCLDIITMGKFDLTLSWTVWASLT